MLKFISETKSGGTLIGIGLSRRNLELLQENKPIIVSGADLGKPDVDVAIFFGETEREMVSILKENGINIKSELIKLDSFRKPKGPDSG